MSLSTSHPPLPPQAFHKAMIFVDGTNLGYRLEGAALIVPDFMQVIRPQIGPMQLVRAYFYTIPHHERRIQARHGEDCLAGFRIVHGIAVPTREPTPKEKSVDALLVGDLVYHSARGNCDHVVIVSGDADFERPIKRVEDFGVRSTVLNICSPDTALKGCCDNYVSLSAEDLVRDGHATPAHALP